MKGFRILTTFAIFDSVAVPIEGGRMQGQYIAIAWRSLTVLLLLLRERICKIQDIS